LAARVTSLALGADLETAQKLILDGKYEEAVKLGKEAVQERGLNQDWPILLSDTRLTLGQYSEAQNVMSNALDRNPFGLRVHLQAREVYLQNGSVEQAKSILNEVSGMLSSRSTVVRDSATVIAMGKAALLLGADARRVLDNFYSRVKKADPNFREVYLAIGQLALDKFDDALAAKNFREGLEHFPDDPDLLAGLAQAYQSGDRSELVSSLEKALERNPRHVPSLLLLADHLIDAEDYVKADEMLNKALAVNPQHPRAWAYRAVLAHLRSQADQEQKARQAALALWKTNPGVDYLIGKKLSQKYRFREGCAYQRRALQSDPEYLPSKSQLAQDLLRLGQEDEGWRLAEEVNQQDGYDVLAYNLVTLHDTVAKYQMLTNGAFRIRMEPHESAVYGVRVTELLDRAQKTLRKKYGMESTESVTVEIFPEQKDFAVRTFGMPGGEGFLGVCFGNVITANSPASQAAHSINWESVLWHEYCHVVTLGLTKNKMPRWLSEGISVFEERQANPAWGERQSPQYREMILHGELTPVGKLSAAFLSPKTPMHLQFAYYESSLVVEYLVDRFGLDALKKILVDLGQGKAINEAIEANTTSLATVEKDFGTFAKNKAEQMGPALDWAQPKPDDLLDGVDSWMKRHPKSLFTLTRQGKKLLAEKKWAEAKAPLQQLIDLYPESSGGESAYLLLAEAQRGLNETNQERASLNKLAHIDANALPAYGRLMEIDLDLKDWTASVRDAERFVAVNPLVAQPYRTLSRAQEELGRDREALTAAQTLLLLDPPDPAEAHYRVARLMYKTGNPGAKREVLQALEEAPRYRDALKLLLQIEAPQASVVSPK
jgi:tetratricopeptide (TPR) repeat protein